MKNYFMNDDVVNVVFLKIVFNIINRMFFFFFLLLLLIDDYGIV